MKSFLKTTKPLSLVPMRNSRVPSASVPELKVYRLPVFDQAVTYTVVVGHTGMVKFMNDGFIGHEFKWMIQHIMVDGNTVAVRSEWSCNFLRQITDFYCRSESLFA